MKRTIATETSLVDMLMPASPKPSFLQRIDKIIDWRPMERSIVRHCGTRVAADGRPGYPALGMFKVLPLQKWYGPAIRPWRRRSTTGFPSPGSRVFLPPARSWTKPLSADSATH